MKKTSKLLSSLAGAACLLCATAANATLYQVNFTASAPWDSGSATPAPQSQVSGSFRFTASSLNADVTSIENIDLAIGGHVYTLAEIDGEAWGGGSYLFGGALNGVNRVDAGTTDFSVWFFPAFNWAQISYSIAGSTDWWSSNGSVTVSEIAVEAPADVPEPGSLALLLAGGLAFLRRRRA